jgi:transposase, IS5 family
MVRIACTWAGFRSIEEVLVLTLLAPQAQCLWDESLPVEVRELPADLAELDRVLSDPALVMVLLEHWRQELSETGRSVICDGRPTIAMETYIRLMVLKARYRWGYRSLVAEVSDSIHLRRFCRIALSQRVPDESTIRKLTRRIGAETVNELTRSLIESAVRQKRFVPRAVRIDSTVVEADVRYPTDADLASHGVKVLAREGRKLVALVKENKQQVRDRSRQVGRALRLLTRSIRRRSGEAEREVLELTEQTGQLLERSIREARTLAKTARAKARGRGAGAKLNAASQLEELASRCEKVAAQIRERVKGQPISDRLVSIADPDARPIRKGKLGKPNEFGYVSQICEITEHTKPGARGLIIATSNRIGNPAEDTLLPDTLGELTRLNIRPREIALDGAFNPGPTRQALDEHGLIPERVFIAGRQQPGSRRTQRRLQRYRTGTEGRISHLKRRYGINRSRLKGNQGRQIWTGWSILAYNADTLAVRAH